MDKKYHIEICHIYQDEHFNKEHKDVLDTYLKYINENKVNHILSILIDNYNIEHKLWHNPIILFNKILNPHNIFNYNIAYENEQIIKAKEILNILKEKKLIYKDKFRKENKNVFFLKENNIPLYAHYLNEDYIHYFCPLLSSAWNLNRLSYKDITNNITFIHEKYRNIIEKEKILLNIIDSNIIHKNEYIFIGE